ncbi:YeeE/YedE thiosulfate transporter family protein [Clostridium sp. CCUG 7971]|uniref:YeeE/YedE thiosulfate transporter family protein n=1 Tax=Clostridium sp. CCUG 7971 TaxID=2811414 RepID=UPI001ABB6A51|nr:YeeE/YedE thiosulfate transporter family protein [Clostridium sp. CCUG 7971]MBO3444425.1 YeeE/YedE family protein [Clostridium sp. CCUG 7971]
MSSVNEAEIKSIRKSRAPRKAKKSQIPIALIVTAIIVAFGIYLSTYNTKLVIYWIFGISFGYILQRSRFCFTAAFRDPCITGSTSVTRAIIVALTLTTIGFTAIKYSAVIKGNEIPGMSAVSPIGIPLIVGAILFGIGMVIAGGCASGTLMRVGEGFSMQMLSLIFFVIGSLWGAHDMGFWGPTFNEKAPKIFLPDVFGWLGALVVQAIILVLLYIAAVKWQEKKMGTGE